MARSKEEAELQARGERINRDGEVVEISEAPVETETIFEDSAKPENDGSTIGDDATEHTPEPSQTETDNGSISLSKESAEKAQI